MTGIVSEGVAVCAGLWFVLKSEEVTIRCSMCRTVACVEEQGSNRVLQKIS